jgi:hypothetical protein
MPIRAIVVFLVLIIGGVYILYHQFTQSPNSYVVWTLFTYILYLAHKKRKDIGFCQLLLPSPKVLFITEYLLISTPFIVLSIITQTYINTLLYTLSPVCIGLIPGRKSKLFSIGIPSFLNLTSIELISFFRRYTILILVTIIAASALCFVPYLSLIILLVFIIIMSNAYTENEPLNMLFLPELSAGQYLRIRINEGFLLYLKLSSPVLLLYTVFNFSTAYLVLIILIIAYIGIVLFVSIKYSFYEANNTKMSSSLIVGIGMIGIIIPPFLPITLFLIFKYYYSAKENLNEYLYVYNK